MGRIQIHNLSERTPQDSRVPAEGGGTRGTPLQAKRLASATQVPGAAFQFRLFPDGHSCFPLATRYIETLCGVTIEAIRDDAESLFQHIHADDIDAVRAAIRNSAATLKLWNIYFRLVQSDGRTASIRGFCFPELQPDGSVIWHGYMVDIANDF